MRLWFRPCIGKISWRRKWLPTTVFSPGESHGQRSLVGYSPWGSKESDTTAATWHGVASIYLSISLSIFIYLLSLSSSPALTSLAFSSDRFFFFLITLRTMSQRTCLENKHCPTPHRVCEGFFFFLVLFSLAKSAAWQRSKFQVS